jgi:hypothetical protein
LVRGEILQNCFCGLYTAGLQFVSNPLEVCRVGPAKMLGSTWGTRLVVNSSPANHIWLLSCLTCSHDKCEPPTKGFSQKSTHLNALLIVGHVSCSVSSLVSDASFDTWRHCVINYNNSNPLVSFNFILGSQLPSHSSCWHFSDSLAINNTANSAFVELIPVACCFVVVFDTFSVECMESVAVSQLYHSQERFQLHVIVFNCFLMQLHLNVRDLKGTGGLELIVKQFAQT